MVFCPICKEELVEPTPKGDYHKFLVPSKCKNNHKFMVAIVAGHLSIGGDYIRVLRRGDKMKEHRIFICDGHADDIEVQQTIDWISEDPENRTATIRPSTPLPSSIG